MLFSTKELDGFEIAAHDGAIGHVREAYFDDERWVIRHLVVDTGAWLSGRDVLISPHAVEQFDREQRRLRAALAVTPRNAGMPEEAAEMAAAQRDAADPHLRSSSEVIGYDIQASDGSVGHIDDFLFDEHSWAIRYAVVDSHNWLPDRLGLVAPQTIERVDWSGGKVHVALTREAVKSSPPYDRSTRLSDEEDERVQRHYGSAIDTPINHLRRSA